MENDSFSKGTAETSVGFPLKTNSLRIKLQRVRQRSTTAYTAMQIQEINFQSLPLCTSTTPIYVRGNYSSQALIFSGLSNKSNKLHKTTMLYPEVVLVSSFRDAALWPVGMPQAGKHCPGSGKLWATKLLNVIFFSLFHIYLACTKYALQFLTQM